MHAASRPKCVPTSRKVISLHGCARLAAGACVAALALRPAFGAPDVSAVDAAARAAGNRRPTAIAIGRALFASVFPVQVLKVRVDGAGSHEIAGLVLSGRKFHGRVDPAIFTDEVVTLVRKAFAASDVEEVDVWTTLPIVVGAHAVVAGDKAEPTTRIVYGATVLRSEGGAFAARLRAGTSVYWYAPWKASLR